MTSQPDSSVGMVTAVNTHLDPGEKQVDRIHVVVLCLPEGKELEIRIDAGFLQQVAEQLVHFDCAENVEGNGYHGKLCRRWCEIFKKLNKQKQTL